MMMPKLMQGIVAVGLLLVPAETSAACRAVGGGSAHVVLEEARKAVEYRLVTRDARWGVDGFGWHATAMSWCEGCNPGSVEGAYVWMEPSTGSDEDDGRFVQTVSSMWFSGYRGSAPEAVGTREPIEWSGLTGYVQRYRGRMESGREVEQLVLMLGDGCLSLKLYSLLSSWRQASPTTIVWPFLTGLRVERRAPR